MVPGAVAERGSRRRVVHRAPRQYWAAVLALLVSEELLVARRAGPRRNILGHPAGPGRPSIGDIAGERRARPEVKQTHSAAVSVNRRLVVPAVKFEPRCPR